MRHRLGSAHGARDARLAVLALATLASLASPRPCAAEAPHPPDSRRNPPRLFVRTGYVIGTARVTHGGVADRGIPFHPSGRPADWDETANGVYAPPGFGSESEWYAAMVDDYGGFTENPEHAYDLAVPVTVDGTTLYAGPLRPDESCDAGPGRFCVGLAQEGFVFLSALDVEVGYRLRPDVAVSVGARVAFPAGEGTLARALLTGRLEIALTRPSRRGFRALASAGVGVGQIQLPVEQAAGRVAPFVTTGLGNLNGAVVLAYDASERFAVVARPTLHVMFPERALVSELFAGVETGF